MIEKFRIRQFCFCCSIRTGSLVIGVFGWMGSLLQAMTLTQPVSKEKITDDGNTIIVEEESGTNVGAILVSLFMFGVSVSLVVGVYRDNRKFILPWLIIKFLEICVLTIITIVVFFLLFVSVSVAPIVVIFIVIGLLTAFYFYAWICVWSLYMDLGEITTSITPIGQSIPMTEPQYPQYPMEEKPTAPMQEMV